MKRFTLVMAFILTISVVLIGCGSKQPLNTKTNTIPKAKEAKDDAKNIKIEPEKVVITITTQKYSPSSIIQAQYPSISGLKDIAAQDKINNTIKGLALKEVMEMANPKYRPKLKDYELNYTATLKKPSIISIEYKGYRDHEDVAHPSNVLFTSNISLLNGKEYIINDLFRKDRDFSSKISELVKSTEAYNKYKTEYSDTIEGYIGSEIYAFTVSDKALKVYYEVPHVIGDYLEFEIPYSLMQDIIDTNGEMWKGINAK